MKRVVLILSCFAFSITVGYAQDVDALNRFMKKYSQNWKEGYMYDDNGKYSIVKQLGTPVPNFHFDKELNDSALKGKYVVLNFWATWCEGCRILSCDIDSMIQINPSVYEGVQVIGVDAHERLADKGFKAKQWWKENITTYPAVYGKASDACCDSLRGGHPSAFLVDNRGIIRGRWDAWSPKVAEEITMAIWALKIMPEQNISVNMEAVNSYMENKDYMKALYLLEMLPESLENSALRYMCMVERGLYWKATKYFDSLQDKYKDNRSEEYVRAMRKIGDYVYHLDLSQLDILKNGINAFQVCMNSGLSNDAGVLERLGVLRIRYAELYKQSGIYMLKQALSKMEEVEHNASDRQRMEELLESYE